MNPETGIPAAVRDALRQIIDHSGLVGDPARFAVTGPEAMPGTLHPLPRAMIGDFPRPVAILVLAVQDGTATVCPVVVPPGRDAQLVAGDRWLPSDDSPFRALPGTGGMQVRTAWRVEVPATALEPAVRRLDLTALVDTPPAHGASPASATPDWRDAWNAAVATLRSGSPG